MYGMYGIYRGFTTSYYSSTTAGYFFFVVYKGLKLRMKEYFQPKTQKQCTLIYFVASTLAEQLSIAIYYPYEILKVRMVAKNDQFNYQSIPDAFKKIIQTEGPMGIYRNSQFFLVNYIMSNTIQMVIYETYMDLKKRKWGNEVFKQNENRYVVEAALLGGAFSGTLMNSYECSMYRRMAQQDKHKSIVQIYKDLGPRIITRGLGTRIVMTQGYSLLYFNLLFFLGKAFDSDLLDEMDDEFLESLPK